jgi:hypothetical protein
MTQPNVQRVDLSKIKAQTYCWTCSSASASNPKRITDLLHYESRGEAPGVPSTGPVAGVPMNPIDWMDIAAAGLAGWAVIQAQREAEAAAEAALVPVPIPVPVDDQRAQQEVQ